MSFEEAFEAEVTKGDAAREVSRHGLDPEEFFREVGDRTTYLGSEVLLWLGY